MTPTVAKPRSVFSNYRATPADEHSGESCPHSDRRQDDSRADSSAHTPPSAPEVGILGPVVASPQRGRPATAASAEELQPAIDAAIARAFIYRFLAAAFADPTTEGWQWLCAAETQANLRAAWAVAQNGTVVPPALAFSKLHPTEGQSEKENRQDTGPRFSSQAFESFHDAYLAAFGHAARGRCPLNEIEYGDLKADPLFQPHRLADLAAFYRAFGLEVAEDAAERHDHVCLELEFMSVLAAKEAYALEHQFDAEALAQCREAQKQFLREHLARWTPAFTRRLERMTDNDTLRALAEFTRRFVLTECARLGVHAGSEDLLLRSVDAAAESLCASCGITNLPPGALRTDAAD